MGKQVGSGECYDLADRALGKSGAQSAPDYGEITDDADYQWGESVDDAKDAQPGDIVQFRDYEVTTTVVTVTRTTKADGSYTEQTQTEDKTVKRPHHTAVINASNAGGGVDVREQNAPPSGKKVQTHNVQTQDSDKTETSSSQK